MSALPEVLVYSKAHEVAGALDALGLTLEIVHESVREGVQPRLHCTLNDPDYLLGIIASGKITTAFRDRVVRQPLKWQRQKVDHQERTVSPDERVAVVVAGGDADTGKDPGNPTTVSQKGKATRQAIALNQYSFADIDPSFSVVLMPTNDQVWMLLYFIDEEADEVRLELSLPAYMEDDYVTGWTRRIILPSVSIDRDPDKKGKPEEDDTEAYKADLSRRAG